MLRRLKNSQGQAVAEYVLIIFVVFSAITGMGFYFRRFMQAKIKDAKDAMSDTVGTRAAGYYTGTLYEQYEPYYVNTQAIVTQDAFMNVELLGLRQGRGKQIFRKWFNQVTAVTVNSTTLPPKDYEP